MRFLDGIAEERLALAQALTRRLQTQRGSLFYDADYGLDLRYFLNTPVNAFQLETQIEAECLKDERVLDADASVLWNPALFTLTVSVSVTTAQGSYDYTIGVSEATVELLTAQDAA